jgi:hypothetical protein
LLLINQYLVVQQLDKIEEDPELREGKDEGNKHNEEQAKETRKQKKKLRNIKEDRI